jgi:hypothetical protein
MPAPLSLALADAVLALHLAFIGWVIFGAFLTRGRPRLAAAHLLTLVYGIIAETTPLICPLTLAENHFESLAGTTPYRGPCVLHYLDAAVYPNVPPWILTVGAILVCGANFAAYAVRYRRRASPG